MQYHRQRRGEYHRRPRPLQRTLAGYAQRYCAKNDTFGFFGPRSWGSLVAGDTRIAAVRQPPRRGTACLELWAVRSLADALEEAHSLSEWTAAQRAPAVLLRAGVAYLPDGSRLPTGAMAAVTLPEDLLIPMLSAALAQVFQAARGLMAEHGLPRLAFAKVSGEVKPVYVDFSDPRSADVLFAKIRRCAAREPEGEVVFTEMLPGPDQLWLRDAAGNRYTAEFRFVCVDNACYRPGGLPLLL